jgi:hypothetical protein
MDLLDVADALLVPSSVTPVSALKRTISATVDTRLVSAIPSPLVARLDAG